MKVRMGVNNGWCGLSRRLEILGSSSSAAAAAAAAEVEFRADLMDECGVVTESLFATLSFNRQTISYNVSSTQSSPLAIDDSGGQPGFEI
jgi:hypothetical protein